MNKGIVMEMSDRHIIVMTPEGDFRKLPHDGRTCEVGEEILFAAPLAARKVPPMAKLSGLVAAVVMCIALVTLLTNMSGKAEIVAYVSMDINPSVEFGIDAAENVEDLKGLNDDGTKLISGIDFRGKGLNTVAEALLTKADAGPLASGDGEIVIASSLVKDTGKISDTAIADKLKDQVTKHIEAVYPQKAANYAVTAFAAPQEVRAAAEANGLSTGKYAIYLAAKNSGTNVPIEDFKTESIHQLAKSNEGIAAVVKAQHPPAKAVFKQLLEDERSGKLDERAKELAEKRNASDTKSGNTDEKNNKAKTDPRGDNKNGKTNEKTSKSSGKNDTRNGGVTRPATGAGKTIGDDNSVDYRNDGKSNGKTNESKNQRDDKANPPRKADDSKAGAKPAASSKNDDKKNDKDSQDNKDGSSQNNNGDKGNDGKISDKGNGDKGNSDKNGNDRAGSVSNSSDKSNGKIGDKDNNDKNSNGKDNGDKDNSGKSNGKDNGDKDNSGKSNGKDNNGKGGSSDRNDRG